jgi:hypothetical protein
VALVLFAALSAVSFAQTVAEGWSLPPRELAVPVQHTIRVRHRLAPLEWRRERQPEAKWILILQHTIHLKIPQHTIHPKNVEAILFVLVDKYEPDGPMKAKPGADVG